MYAAACSQVLLVENLKTFQKRAGVDAVLSLKMEKLVLTVSVYSKLYDMSDRNYHNRDRKAHLWEQIARSLNVSGVCCAFITLRIESLLLTVQ